MNNLFILTMLMVLVGFERGFGQDASAVVTHESTSNANDGAIDLTVSGGYSPYTFLWSGPFNFTAVSQDIDHLSPGQYCVTVTDALCGTLALCAIVRECDPIISLAGNIPCAGGLGNINLLLRGRGPFTLKWSDGTGQSIQNNIFTRNDVNPGFYCVTVTNAAGCSDVDCVSVFNSTEALQVSAATTQPQCAMAGGSINLSVTGGVPPYTYNWSNASTTEDLPNVSPGTYCVTVADASGCTKSECFTISSATGIIVDVASINNTDDCLATIGCNGSIDIEVENGTPPFTYLWTGPSSSTQQDPTGLCVGNYMVQVTDAHECTATKSISLCCCEAAINPHTGQLPPHACSSENEGNSSDVIINSNVTSSVGNTQGAIEVSASGGTGGPYYYSWSSSTYPGFKAYSPYISNLAPGQYCVTVTDGCSDKIKCFTIFDCDSAPLSISGTTQPTCPDLEVGSVSLNVSGGSLPYAFSWSTGAPNSVLINNLPPGNYCVTVSDHNFCKSTACFTVGQIPISIEDEGCTEKTYCGQQLIAQQTFSSSIDFSKTACEMRIVCANGYTGPWGPAPTEIVNTTGSPYDCLKQKVCIHNDIILDVYFGIEITETEGGVDQCGNAVCVNITKCEYPDLGEVDPNSEQLAGGGDLTTSPAFGPTFTCSCGMGTCCQQVNYYCDNMFIGSGQQQCGALAINTEGTPEYIVYSKEILIDLAARQNYRKDSIYIKFDQNDIPLAQKHISLSRILGGNLNIRVHPNPFRDVLTMTIHSDCEQDLLMEIRNIAGEVVYIAHLHSMLGMNTFDINLDAHLPAGIYLAKVTDETGNSYIHKIIKMH